MESASFIKRYKIPLLIALVVALAVITLGYENSAIGAVLTFVTAILGMFLTDLGSVLHAYVVDPSTDNSQTLIQAIEKKSLKGVMNYFSSQEYTVADPTVKTILFQLLLMLFVFYTTLGGITGFAKAFVLSFAGNLLYFQLVELQVTKTLKRWFWVYKGYVSHKTYTTYVVIITLIYVYSFTFI